MGHTKKMAENIAKSLVFAIKAHRHHIGIYPAKIFAELDAYYALKNENPMKLFDYYNQEFAISRFFGGIPIVPISKEGFGIYLSSGAIEIREFQDPDAEPIVQKETRYG